MSNLVTFEIYLFLFPGYCCTRWGHHLSRHGYLQWTFGAFSSPEGNSFILFHKSSSWCQCQGTVELNQPYWLFIRARLSRCEWRPWHIESDHQEALSQSIFFYYLRTNYSSWPFNNSCSCYMLTLLYICFAASNKSQGSQSMVFPSTLKPIQYCSWIKPWFHVIHLPCCDIFTGGTTFTWLYW